jgi:hypothetical protein
MRLASLHAVHQLVTLTRDARRAILAGRYAEFRTEFLDRFRSGATLAPSLAPDPDGRPMAAAGTTTKEVANDGE